MKPFRACCAALCLSMLMPAFSNAQSPADFTAEAASFNQFEVEASRLALKSAQDDATKMFANDIKRSSISPMLLKRMVPRSRLT